MSIPRAGTSLVPLQQPVEKVLPSCPVLGEVPGAERVNPGKQSGLSQHYSNL